MVHTTWLLGLARPVPGSKESPRRMSGSTPMTEAVQKYLQVTELHVLPAALTTLVSKRIPDTLASRSIPGPLGYRSTHTRRFNMYRPLAPYLGHPPRGVVPARKLAMVRSKFASTSKAGALGDAQPVHSRSGTGRRWSIKHYEVSPFQCEVRSRVPVNRARSPCSPSRPREARADFAHQASSCDHQTHDGICTCSSR
jgi:hypothetical protein